MPKRVRNHANPLNCMHRLSDVALPASFLDGPLDLEIGVGRGVFLSEYAKRHPNRRMVGMDVRLAIVKAFNARYSLENVRVFWASAAVCLEDLISDNSLHRVFIFHPDPWFKARHAKRRVVCKELFDILSKKMHTKGMIYISTDVDALHADMCAIIASDQRLMHHSDDSFWTSEYKTHWSQFSASNQRNQHFITTSFKEAT